MFATTPPLEAKRALFSMTVTGDYAGKKKGKSGNKVLVFIDVRRAYVYAKARRAVLVALCDEDAEPRMCGRLLKSMYGTRDAAMNWEEEHTDHHIKHGFIPRAASPCALYTPTEDIACVVHGYDLNYLADEDDVDWIVSMMKRKFEIKTRGILGSRDHNDKSIIILNRVVEWTKAGITYEADPRHSEIFVR